MFGALICIHPTVADIFLFKATRIKLRRSCKSANDQSELAQLFAFGAGKQGSPYRKEEEIQSQ